MAFLLPSHSPARLARTGLFRWARGGLLLTFLLAARVLLGQATTPDLGAISGTVMDSWDGRGLPGVTVVLRGSTLATTTDSVGNYTLPGVPPGNHSVQFTKGGYVTTLVENIKVAAGQVSRGDMRLKPNFFLLDTYEVVAEPLEEQQVELLKGRRESLVLADFLGSEQMSRLGVGDAAEALTKVTGASIVDGKFAVIRGLSDRYTSATLAGTEIPSADPYRKSAQLDLFPSSMIERIEVSKTFTPDQPGGFTGGSINIVPKSIPTTNFFKFSLGGSYNTQTTGKEMLTSPGGGLDWLGMDDGTRAFPPGLEPDGVLVPASITARFNPAARALLNDLTRSFTLKQMGATRESAPFNHDFSLSGGDRWKVATGEMGYYATLSYKHDYEYFEGGQFQRHQAVGVNTYQANVLAEQSRGVSEVSWGGAFGLGWRPSEHHELAFTFLNTQTGENSAYRIAGFNRVDFGSIYEATTLQYTERNLRSFLFRGKHEFPDVRDALLEWQVATTTTTQEDPDLRVVAALRSPGGTFFDNGVYPQNPSRFWRDLEEKNLSYRVDTTFPFVNWALDEGKFKFGFNIAESQRDFVQSGFAYLSENGYAPWNASGELIDLIPVQEATLNAANHRSFYIRRETVNRYEGIQQIRAGYGMVELPVWEKLKLIGGGRAESTQIDIDSTGGSFFVTTAKSALKQTDYLPALGAIYNPITNVNIRLHYSETVARPTYREIANVATFDYIGGEILVGNPDLQLSAIKNYDVRVEWFPGEGNVFSVGGFYKELTDPIELFYNTLDKGQLSYQNRESAIVFGWEAEARIGLGLLTDQLKDFSVGVNYAWIHSETDLTPNELANKQRANPATKSSRPMYDQSPYILNADFSYDSKRLGLAYTVAYNLTGPRLAIADPEAVDIYEFPGASLDMSLSKSLGKHWKLKLSAKNLLNPVFERTYGEDKLFPYSSYRKGREFGLSLSCSF